MARTTRSSSALVEHIIGQSHLVLNEVGLTELTDAPVNGPNGL